jgi:hypothetical protein
MIVFTKQTDGTFAQSGDVNTEHGRFQWQNDKGVWDGGWAVEPIADLLDRMMLHGPYKYDVYRILPATKPELIINPTCAGCGVIAGIDCQRSAEYIFGRADVVESLPIEFNPNHQFSLTIEVVTKGRSFEKKIPKQFWFNSVRCAEIFLMERGECQESSAVIGDGTRLLAFLGGAEVVKARKKRDANRSYLERLAKTGTTESYLVH